MPREQFHPPVRVSFQGGAVEHQGCFDDTTAASFGTFLLRSDLQSVGKKLVGSRASIVHLIPLHFAIPRLVISIAC